MDNRKIPDAAINAAAEWWANRISGQTIHDNGDPTFGSVFAGMLADQMVKPSSDAQLQKFKNSLVMRLSEYASIGSTNIRLESDYAPCKMLSDSAKDADIPLENFPWKVCMYVEPKYVQVSDGYGMPWVNIWPVADKKNDGEEGAA